MTLDDVILAIRSRAETLWPAIEPTVPLAFESENFEKPIGPDQNPLPFVIVDPQWVGGEFVSVGSPGSNITRREGIIWIHAMIPQGTGVSRAHQLAARAGSMFEGVDFSGIVCWGMAPGGAADEEDGLYFGQSVEIPFYYDETA